VLDLEHGAREPSRLAGVDRSAVTSCLLDLAREGDQIVPPRRHEALLSWNPERFVRSPRRSSSGRGADRGGKRAAP
jgi:hypothetical protein